MGSQLAETLRTAWLVQFGIEIILEVCFLLNTTCFDGKMIIKKKNDVGLVAPIRHRKTERTIGTIEAEHGSSVLESDLASQNF